MSSSLQVPSKRNNERDAGLRTEVAPAPSPRRIVSRGPEALPRAGLDSPLATAGNDDKRENRGDKVAHQALRYQGTRYRFGGNSKSKGFDCSGLVMRVYNDLKFNRLPHNSSGLYQMGQPVPTRELRPGDLVFFKNTYRHGISHVGVYAGKNRFIHAMDRRHGVTVSLLSDPYFQLHYAGARRLY